MSQLGDRILSRTFFVSTRAFDAGMGVSRGTFDGVWLGLLNPRRVSVIDEAYFHRQRMYLAEDYNRRGLWPWERAAVEAHFPHDARIAVTAAGGGREVLALLDLGFDAVGFECNERLQEFGNDLTIASGHGIRIHPSGRDEWPKAAVGFDAAIIGWGSYMHIAGRQHRVAMLRDARAALPNGAPLMLSFFQRRGTTLRFRSAATVGNVFRRLFGRELLEPGDALSPLYAHFFTKDEIENEINEAGFELVDYSSDPYPHAVAKVTEGNLVMSEACEENT
jgi:hypothetical protein